MYEFFRYICLGHHCLGHVKIAYEIGPPQRFGEIDAPFVKSRNAHSARSYFLALEKEDTTSMKIINIQ